MTDVDGDKPERKCRCVPPAKALPGPFAIGILHGSIMSGLERPESIVMCGLSIDPLDAELAQTLAAGFATPHLKGVYIVDPCHQLVAGRVQLLLGPSRSVEVVCHCPSEVG